LALRQRSDEALEPFELVRAEISSGHLELNPVATPNKVPRFAIIPRVGAIQHDPPVFGSITPPHLRLLREFISDCGE
jgi:hypothetical protein